MQVVKPTVEIVFEDVDSTNAVAVYKKVEEIARCCYKSEDKITPTSYKAMLKTLRDKGHLAMLEHHNIVFAVKRELFECISSFMGQISLTEDGSDVNDLWRAMRYINFTADSSTSDTNGHKYLISGSPTAFSKIWSIMAPMREKRLTIVQLCRAAYQLYPELVVLPNGLDHDDVYKIPDTIVGVLNDKDIWNLPRHIRRYHQMVTVRFVTDRGVTHEIVRHRPASYAHESTRYVDYGKRGCAFILPCWFREIGVGEYRFDEGGQTILKIDGDIVSVVKCNSYDPEIIEEYNWLESCLRDDKYYTGMVRKIDGKQVWAPQKSRSVLPQSMRTEIYMSATVQEWEWFSKMRDAITAHPQMQELATPLHTELKKRNYTN